MAFVRIDDLAFLTVAGLWVSGLSYETIASPEEDASLASFLGAVALGILAYKGFTTITNSGSEIKNRRIM